MNQEVNIIDRVLKAQRDIDAADSLIREYLPFVKSETAKTIGRIPVEGADDELSIALMGFHEAIESYNQEKGAFLNFASVVIKRRIIDFIRHENQFRQQFPVDENDVNNMSGSVSRISSVDPVGDRQALKWEIAELTKVLAEMDITISKVADECPRREKTVKQCREAVISLLGDPDGMNVLLNTGKIPINRIMKETSVKKKTLEKHRKYIIALALIYFYKYECLMDYLAEVFKNQKGGK